ncbi:hypothetical protein [Haladaptatus halobius]|uniref:hypothetical protein n=1 Tax=Haladaptatus halobius TaxID=2884875 RepID=UPI001D0ACBF5|nr:hypothetical protein [Haladaptatus halobius]
MLIPRMVSDGGGEASGQPSRHINARRVVRPAGRRGCASALRARGERSEHRAPYRAGGEEWGHWRLRWRFLGGLKE